ncbi:chromodomain-helicase-DNA-binding protein 3 [Cryptococcus gattii Ru294]|nr:chromodomain-helicase-DNA-binding protein 3 [Cryptococcus gattii Ru294]
MASTARAKSVRNILMELRKVCQHPYLSAPELEAFDLPPEEQHRQLLNASGKLQFLKLLIPKLIARGHRILLFSQISYMAIISSICVLTEIPNKHRGKSPWTYSMRLTQIIIYFFLQHELEAWGLIWPPQTRSFCTTLISILIRINRAYRYGQKKTVLVFKLMIKGSVEETIMNKGKRKMVLDHLVVQQMGKETEENDFEDLFLKGVEGMYSGQGSINIPDINYNSKNVDELIDRVEADAEAEAKAITERKRESENGVVKQIKSKQGVQFQFSKIWEAGQNELVHDEVQETVKDDEEEEDVDWEQLMVTVQAERQLRLQKEMGESRMRRKVKPKEGIYRIDDDFEVNEKKRRRSKGKGREGQLSSSDAEYMEGALSDDDSATDMPDIDLETMEDDLSTDLMLAKLSSGVKRKRSKKTPNNAFNQSTIPPKSVFHVGANETPSGNLAPHSAQSELSSIEPRQINRMRYSSLSEAGPPGSVASVNTPEVANDVSSSLKKKRTIDSTQARQTHIQSHHVTPPIEITAAQNILQWLFLIIRELSWHRHVGYWAALSLRELPLEKRKKIYYTVAADVDVYLRRLRQPPYFLEREQREAVERLLGSAWPIIPDASAPIAVPERAAALTDQSFSVGGSGYKEGALAPIRPVPPKHVSETLAILAGTTPPEVPENNGNTGDPAKSLLNTVASQDTVSPPDVRAAGLSSSFKEKEHVQNRSDTTDAGSCNVPLAPQISEQTMNSTIQMPVVDVLTPSLSTGIAPVETSQSASLPIESPSVSCQQGRVKPTHSTDSSPREMNVQISAARDIQKSNEGASVVESAPLARASDPALTHPYLQSRSILPNQLSSSQVVKGTLSSSSRQSSEVIVAGSSAEPSRCEYCLEDGHKLQDCQRMYSIETLEKAFFAIQQSNLPAGQKRRDLEILESLKSLLIKAGKLHKDYHFPDPTPFAVKSNKSRSPNASHPIAPESRAQGQLILGGVDGHTPKEGKHDISASERPVRACIQATGDRKSLKRKIRRLKEKIDELTNAPGERETDKQHAVMIVLRKMQSSLFDCYKNWPKERPSGP